MRCCVCGCLYYFYRFDHASDTGWLFVCDYRFSKDEKLVWICLECVAECSGDNRVMFSYLPY